MGEWLPEDHAVWFVIGLVAEFNLSGFEAGYRLGGRGRRAWDPAMLVTLLIWSYSQGMRSSRRIERACVENVAWRVICGGDGPDHSTICRFRQDHQAAIEGLLVQTLLVCDRLEMLPLGTLAVDGTKIGADAGLDGNRRRAGLEAEAARVMAEAAAADEADLDAGGRVPAELARPARRLERIRAALAELDTAEGGEDPDARVNVADPESRIVKTRAGFVQGYNAQTVVGDGQIILGVTVTQAANDFGLLCPMLDQARTNLAAAGVTRHPEVVLADAGYFEVDDVAELEQAMPDTTVLVATGNRRNTVTDPGPDPEALHAAAVAEAAAARSAEQARRAEIFAHIHATGGDIRTVLDQLGLSQSHAYAAYAAWREGGDSHAVPAATPKVTKKPSEKAIARWAMNTRLARPENRHRYRQRGHLIEGTFAAIKTQRGGSRFIRRGLAAVNTEFHLDAIAHNTLKIIDQLAPQPA